MKTLCFAFIPLQRPPFTTAKSFCFKVLKRDRGYRKIGMNTSRPDHQTRFKPIGDRALAERPVAVKLPQHVDAAIRDLALPSEWLRRVICEAAERELLDNNF